MPRERPALLSASAGAPAISLADVTVMERVVFVMKDHAVDKAP